MKKLLLLLLCLLGAAAGRAQTCPSATAPIISNLTTNSATVNFTPAAGAATYTVTVTTPGGTVVQTRTTTASPLNLMGLFPSGAYTVSIVTTCANGGVSAPATVSFLTASAPVNCPAIAGLTVTSTLAPSGAATATVNFLPTAGASGYLVAHSAVGVPLVQTTVNNPPATLNNLIPGLAYTVRVTSNCNGGSGTPVSANFTTTLGAAARSMLAGGYVLVFPNPAHQAFTLRLPALQAARTARLELVNALGQVVRAQRLLLPLTGGDIQVPVVDLATGLYLVRVQAGDETATSRLVVE